MALVMQDEATADAPAVLVCVTEADAGVASEEVAVDVTAASSATR